VLLPPLALCERVPGALVPNGGDRGRHGFNSLDDERRVAAKDGEQTPDREVAGFSILLTERRRAPKQLPVQNRHICCFIAKRSRGVAGRVESRGRDARQLFM
jgi:hypothetical protein